MFQKLERWEEAASVLDEMVARFGAATEPVLREQADRARDMRAALARMTGAGAPDDRSRGCALPRPPGSWIDKDRDAQ